LFLTHVNIEADLKSNRDLLQTVLKDRTLGPLLVADETAFPLLRLALELAADWISSSKEEEQDDTFAMLREAIRLWSTHFVWFHGPSAAGVRTAAITVARYLQAHSADKTTLENLGLLVVVNSLFSMKNQHSLIVEETLHMGNSIGDLLSSPDCPQGASEALAFGINPTWSLKDLVVHLQSTMVRRGDTKTLLSLWALLLRLDCSPSMSKRSHLFGGLRELCGGLGIKADELYSNVLELWERQMLNTQSVNAVRWWTHLDALDLATSVFGFPRPHWVSRLLFHDLIRSTKLESIQVMTRSFNRFMFSLAATRDLDLRFSRHLVVEMLKYDPEEGVALIGSLLAILSVNQVARLRKAGKILPSDLVKVLAIFFRSVGNQVEER